MCNQDAGLERACIRLPSILELLSRAYRDGKAGCLQSAEARRATNCTVASLIPRRDVETFAKCSTREIGHALCTDCGWCDKPLKAKPVVVVVVVFFAVGEKTKTGSAGKYRMSYMEYRISKS